MPEQNKRTPYHSNLSNKQWEIIKPHLPSPSTNRGRKRVHSYREILNAIFYLLRSGCAWRMLPTDSHRGKLSSTISVFGDLLDFGNV